MKRRGFTLVEILVVVALVAMIFIAINTLLFSMTELWGRGGEKHRFERHVRNLSRYLEDELRQAALPPAGIAEKKWVARDVRLENGRSELLVLFSLPKGSRLLTWPEAPLPDVVCGLTVRAGEGLFLVWHSRWEEKFEDDAPRELLLSPWVTQLRYDYYEAGLKTWKTETTVRQASGGGGEVPQRLRLTFKYDVWEMERVIPLRADEGGVPFL